jgi:hypothetical protein
MIEQLEVREMNGMGNDEARAFPVGTVILERRLWLGGGELCGTKGGAGDG